MAIQSYNSEITRTASTTDVALERLRNLEIVNRFTGETLTDASNTVLGTTDNFVTPATRNVTATGVHAVIGKTIFIDAGVQLLADANNVHFQFFNCSFIYRPSGSIGSGSQPVGTGQDLNSDAIDSRVSEGAASTRSVSFYGCSFTVAPTAAANIFLQFGDVMNSTIQFGGGVHTPLPCFNVGSRAINATFLCENVGNTAVLEIYGAPEISEGLVIRNHSIEITGTGAGALTETYQQLYTSPNFTGPGNLQRWRTQDSAQGQSAFQVIGPFNPFNNVLNDTVRTSAGDNGVQTFAHLRSNTGQILNYYGWTPGFFADVANTQPILNVNARLRTSATLANTAINGTGGQTSMLTAISNTPTGYGDLSSADKDTGVIYRSNADGVLVADNTALYTTNGANANNHTTGWIDFLRLRPYNETGTTTGGNTLGETWFDAAAPANTIFAPIAQVTGTSYGQYESDIDYRSYSHDIDYFEEQNGVIGTAAGNQASSTLSPIDDSNYIGGTLIGTRVKDSNIDNATNLPDFSSFTADSTVSLNDIGNALRAGWASHNVNANQGTVLQTGNFNETTYPTRIHIRTAAETGGNTWQDPKWGVKVASAGSGGQIRIAVLGNGIAGKDDDLYETLPGARTYNFAGLPLSNVVLGAQERLARIGNIHNVELSSGLDGAGPSGANDFYDIQFETTSNTITGLTTLTPGSARIAAQAVINLPTVVGDSASDVTLTRGRIIQTFSSGATVGVEGVRDNSSWVNFSTSTDVTSTVLPNVTINGGTHGMTIGGLNTSTAVWTFTNMEANAMNITLPTGTPTPLVRINTDNQAGNITNYNEVKRWLDAEVARDSSISYSNVRLDETAPTSGYWLVAPPLAPAEPRTFTIAPPIANLTNSTLQNVIAAGGSFVYETGGTVTSHHISNATTLDDITITTNNEADDDYNIWYKPLSYVDGNDSIIYDYNHTTWNPTTDASGSIGIFQPDPNGAVTGTATFDSTTTGVVTFNTPVRTGTALSVTLTSGSDDSGAVQSLGWAIANSSQYMEYVAANTYTNASTRPLQFDKSGTGATTTFATNITLRSTTGQRFLNGASGFVTQQAGTAPNTFPEVRGSATNVIFGSDAQISALAGGDAITELGNELKANQGKLSTDVRLSSQFRVASGTIPNTAD